jgi:hypothetical protein
MRRLLALILAAVIFYAPTVYARGGSGHSGSSHHSSSSGKTTAKKPGSSSGKTTARKPGSDHAVSGYTKKNGTVMKPYRATNPNKTKNDNYSTKGNVNPYTGKPGTKKRDGQP